MGGRGASSGQGRKTVSEIELTRIDAKIKSISAKVDKINEQAEKNHGIPSEKTLEKGMKLFETLTELTQKKRDLEKKIAVEKETAAFLRFAKNRR